MTGADNDGRLVCLECGGRYRHVGMIARFPVVRLGRRAWSHPASKTHVPEVESGGNHQRMRFAHTLCVRRVPSPLQPRIHDDDSKNAVAKAT